jgi:hypothetical protein
MAGKNRTARFLWNRAVSFAYFEFGIDGGNYVQSFSTEFGFIF